MPTATAQTTRQHASTGTNTERLPALACVLAWFATAGSIWAVIFALVD